MSYSYATTIPHQQRSIIHKYRLPEKDRVILLIAHYFFLYLFNFAQKNPEKLLPVISLNHGFVEGSYRPERDRVDGP